MKESLLMLFYKYHNVLEGKEKAPALIFLHGRGTDENDLLGFAPSFEENFILYSVRAPFPFEFGGYMWCEIDEYGNIDREQLLQSRTQLEIMIEDISKNQNIDSSKIFLFGFSLGALMALDVGINGKANIEGIVAHSGFYGGDSESFPVRESFPEIFLAHGTYDPVIPIDLCRRTYQLLLQHKVPVLFREYPIVHTISEESLNDSVQWLQEQIRE